MAKTKTTGTGVVVGAGLAAVAAFAAAGYFLYGKDGAKNRKKDNTLCGKMQAFPPAPTYTQVSERNTNMEFVFPNERRRIG